MYLAKTPNIVKPLTKDLIWHVNTGEKTLFLTFDDGPTPDVTDQVLDLLKKFNARACFFCVGSNVQKHRSLFRRIMDEGHSIGNHTFNHCNGWKTNNLAYYRSYLACANIMNSRLFRPPYGKISKSQAKAISSRSKIIMWDVLSGDFDVKSSPEKCLNRVVKNAKAGSIIVFHDSLKAKDRMLYALQGTLSHFNSLGYTFKALDNSLI